MPSVNRKWTRGEKVVLLVDFGGMKAGTRGEVMVSTPGLPPRITFFARKAPHLPLAIDESLLERLK